MATVTFDERSFLADGERLWLVSGSVDYFRVPALLWADRLLKARRGGLNCIATFVPWNFHEPVEGQWDFSGDRDIAAFIEMAEELGLYVILRPGPFIGADWDFGGLPAWLTSRAGMAYRTNSAAYTHYLDKYIQHVLPPLADHQVTRGGNIVLIQNESWYYQTAMPDRLSYLEFVSQLFRRSGFDIPIINSNDFSDPPLPDSIECVRGSGDAVQRLKRLRVRQPAAPLVAIELRGGSADRWGGEHATVDARATARRAMEALGCGAQINYHMYHGGTNFGFWAGRLSDSDAAYQTTSYDHDAPIAEGGGLTEKYYLARLPNLLAEHMGRFLARCRCEPPAASIHDATDVLNLSGPDGSWAFVTNNGRGEIETVTISLPTGRELTVPLSPIGAAAIPYGLALTAEVILDYVNLTPLGFFHGRTLVLHGPVGWAARVSINGQELRDKVPKGDSPTVVEHQGVQVVLVSSELAARTFLVQDTLVFGAEFVGETLEQVTLRPGMHQCAMLPLGGGEKPTQRKPVAPPAPRTTAPKLKLWKRMSVCTEPVSADLEWKSLDRPCDLDRLGVAQGYAWYRMQWNEKSPRKCELFLPDCEDRATIFLNGSMAGVWGRGPGALRRPIPVEIPRGENALVILADNLGRSDCAWRLGEQKGLWGPIYDAKALPIRKPKLIRQERFSRRIVPRTLTHLLDELEALPAWAMDVDVSLSQVRPVHLSFAGLPHHVAVLCNDRPMGFYPAAPESFGDLTLGAGLKKGRNLLQFILWGDVQADVADRLTLYSLLEPLSEEAKWSWRPWEMPRQGGPVVGKDQPAWYVARFSGTAGGEPLFLHIAGSPKGQIFLNGQNVGRFWSVGPQQYYYLPSCWLRDDNELLLFVETGDLPRRTLLEIRPLGPYRP